MSQEEWQHEERHLKGGEKWINFERERFMPMYTSNIILFRRLSIWNKEMKWQLGVFRKAFQTCGLWNSVKNMKNVPYVPSICITKSIIARKGCLRFPIMNNSAAAAATDSSLSPVFLQSLCQRSLTAALINSPLCNDLGLLAVYMAHTHISIY